MADASTISCRLLAAAEIGYRQLAIGSAVLVGLMICAFYGVAILRRRLKSKPPSSPQQAFTLHNLRQLHQQGQLSDEEYDRAKAHMISQYGVDRSTGSEDADSAGEKL